MSGKHSIAMSVCKAEIDQRVYVMLKVCMVYMPRLMTCIDVHCMNRVREPTMTTVT